MTQTGAGTLKPASLENLALNNDGTAKVDAKITFADNKTEINIAGSMNTTAGAVSIKNAEISAESLKGAIGKTDFEAGGYTVTAGVVENAANEQIYLNDKGALVNSNEAVYHVQADGAITNGSGKLAYKDANGKITAEAQTATDKTTDPLKALDKALAQVDALRSDLGAVQNRFDSTITNLGNTVNNLSSARSRIEDADYATEVSNMSRAQILQQAGTSVLAQANQTTQNVLSLLR
ncbi:flagellin [Citrobacter sp. RHBSTW-00570]|uniref:flagellin n=1 Tax=Citrobacter sp. RHBSTW-00570 TaxID=2742655 RepID=UPI0015EC1CBC|nr:flagellin [Citrobacter sp. RHBSTW-00570]